MEITEFSIFEVRGNGKFMKHQNKPSVDILALLISLYADQNGIEITYKLKEKDNGQG